MSSLNPFLNSCNIELKTSLFVDFVSALFSKHLAIPETLRVKLKSKLMVKNKLRSPRFWFCNFSYSFVIFIYIF